MFWFLVRNFNVFVISLFIFHKNVFHKTNYYAHYKNLKKLNKFEEDKNCQNYYCESDRNHALYIIKNFQIFENSAILWGNDNRI